MEIDFQRKRWPDPKKLIWKSEDLENYDSAPFVKEGRVVCRLLGRKGISKPIPPEEGAIAGLTVAPNGLVYGLIPI